MGKKILKILIGLAFLPITLIYLIWKKTNWNNKGKILGTVGVLIFFIIAGAFGNSEDVEQTSVNSELQETTTSATETEQTSEQTTTETEVTTVCETTIVDVTTVTIVTTELVEPDEHNTTAYVDYLARKAKADAKKVTDEEIQEAIDWIFENKDNLFADNETMEKAMYYGNLLNYKYKGIEEKYENTGFQVFKTIKYVYRGEEKIEDTVT